jgi:hypothetical protein
MELRIDGEELRLIIKWQRMQGLIKSLLPLIAAILGLLAAPEVIQLGQLLGWW